MPRPQKLRRICCYPDYWHDAANDTVIKLLDEFEIIRSIDYGGNMGSADEAVQAFLAHTLVQNDNLICAHHHEHGEGHSCGSHS